MYKVSPEIWNKQDFMYEYLNLRELEQRIVEFIRLERINCPEVLELLLELSKVYLIDDMVPCIVFANKRKKIYIPVAIADYYFGTNGMAAGNDYYEAFVQAFSEIMERNAIKKFLKGQLHTYWCSEEFKSDSSVALMIKEIEESGFKSEIYTFEPEMNYPVVLVLIKDVNKNRIKYRFGAHCDVYYAIERCFTEIVQGCDLEGKNWIEIDEIIKEEKDNSYEVFLNGTGCLSNVAYSILLNTNEEFRSKWKIKSYMEAVKLIKKDYRNLCIKVYGYTPLVTLQIYIPQVSKILDFGKDNLATEIELIGIKKLIQRIVEGKCKKSDLNEFRNFLELCDSKMFEDGIGYLCPIQKQYLRYLFYERKLDKIIELYGTTSILSDRLKYCPKCKYYNTNNCIEANRKRYFSLLGNSYEL